MGNPNRVMGRAKIRTDGLQLDTEGKSTLQIGGIKRNPVQGDYTTGRFSEEDMDSQVECSVLMTAGTSLAALGAIDDATISFECDTGQTYIIRHAYVMEPPSLSEGKAKLTFVGPAAEEMVV